jgi:hypothetical protein
MDHKVIDEAMAFIRKHSDPKTKQIPEWPKYQALVEAHLKDDYNPRPKVPKEYMYAYYRSKGLNNEEALDSMGLGTGKPAAKAEKKSSWKFW